MQIVKADTKGIKLAIKYLKRGKSVVYPTDTCYGLGVNATNVKVVRSLYKIKERGFNQPVHVIVGDLKMAKRYVKFDETAERLFKKFLPGKLTLVLDLCSPPIYGPMNRQTTKALGILSAGTGTLGIRMPDNKIALSLVRKLGRPITTPSANPPNSLGGYDSYSADDVVKQFKNKKYQPDLCLDAGRLPKVKPSTIVRIEKGKIKVLRYGPVSKKQIEKILKQSD